MKPLLCLALLAAVIAGAGCIHGPPLDSVLVLDDSDFVQSTGIDRLIIIPKAVPEVQVPAQKAGRYRCWLWSENHRQVRTCQADTGIIVLTAPECIRVVSTQPSAGSRQDYLVEIEYFAPTGETSRLVQLVAAWW